MQEGGAGRRPYPIVPFSLILASSMAKVMWSWCSMPLATRLNATWAQEQETLLLPRDRVRPPPPPGKPAPHLEEVLRYAGEALRVVRDALQVGVLVQDVVVDVQEELERVLVQEVYLRGRDDRQHRGAQRRGPRLARAAAPVTCFRASMVK